MVIRVQGRAGGRQSSRHTGRDETGETLVELVIATAILGTAVVALVGGIGTSIVMSDIHRKEAVAGAVVRTYAESIEASVAATPTGYSACAKPSSYALPATFTAQKDYAAQVTAVLFWNVKAGAFVSRCDPDSGVQKVSLAVSSTDSEATEILDVIIRNPCRTTDKPC
jgi:type II secretory pathway pseudopilin PulG